MSHASDDLSRVRKARLEKLAALQERGWSGFALSFDVTRHAAPVGPGFEEDGGRGGADETDGDGAERTVGGRMVGFVARQGAHSPRFLLETHGESGYFNATCSDMRTR